VTSSANPSVFGQTVTFTATVTADAPGSGTPTGTADFFIDGSDASGPVTLSGGSATFSTAGLTIGTHSISVTYNGDTNFNSSSGILSGGQTVNMANSTTTVVSDSNPSTLTQNVTFTATVSAASPGSGTPTGTVDFFIDGGDVSGPLPLSGGTANFSTATLGPGVHSVSASYSGDANFNASSGSLPGGQTVSGSPSTTTVASSVNPSAFGQTVTFTATVSGSSGTPTGTVDFFIDGSDASGPVPLSGGTAAFSTAGLSVGTHTVTASYSGDSNFVPSSGTLSGGQTVNQDGSHTFLGSTANPSVSGQTVTFNVIETALSPGSGTPTGTVT
jgi:hypothetical protein